MDAARGHWNERPSGPTPASTNGVTLPVNGRTQAYFLLLLVAMAICWTFGRTPTPVPGSGARPISHDVRRASRPATVAHGSRTQLPKATGKNEETPGFISGHVLSIYGDPVSDAAIGLFRNIDGDPGKHDENPDHHKRNAGQVYRQTVSRSDSGYEFTGLPLGTYVVHASSGDLATLREIRLTPNSPCATVSLVLEAGSSIRGRIINARGDPVPWATVTPFEHDDREVQRGIARSCAVQTSEGGLFETLTLARRQWRLHIEAPGYAPLRTYPIDVGTDDLTLTLSFGRSITGTVTSTTGAPVRSVRVVAGKPRTSIDDKTSVTDDRGRFSFDGLSNDRYGITLDDEYWVFEPATELVDLTDASDAPDLRLTAVQGATITGYVQTSDKAKPVTAVKILATPITEGLLPKKSPPSALNGEFLISGLASGEYRILPVDSTGYVQGSIPIVSVAAGEYVENIIIVFNAGAPLSGQVLMPDDAPAARATVRCEWKQESLEVQTDEHGMFELAGIPPNSQTFVTASAEPNLSATSGPFEFTAQGLTGIQLRLEPSADGILAGQVVDRYGKPAKAVIFVAGQSIESDSTKRRKTVVTDYAGNFAISVPTPARYLLELGPYDTRGFYRPLVKGGQFDLVAGQQLRHLRLVYDEGALLTITGHVVNEALEPVCGAMVSAGAPPGANPDGCLTDENGEFRLMGLSDAYYELSASHKDYQRSFMHGIAAGSKNVQLVLRGIPKIKGKVLDARTRSPITQFQVAVVPENLPVKSTQAFKPVVNARGEFTIEAPRNGSGDVVADADGYLQGRVSVYGASASASPEVAILLEPGSIPVSGLVLDNNGMPVSGARVMPQFGPSIKEIPGALMAETDADGRFRFEDVPPETAYVSAGRAGYAASTVAVVPQANEETWIEIVLEQPGGVEGVVSINGQPVPGVSVYASASRSQNCMTDEHGYFKIDNLPPAEITIRIRGNVDETGVPAIQDERTITIESGTIATVSFDLTEPQT